MIRHTPANAFAAATLAAAVLFTIPIAAQNGQSPGAPAKLDREQLAEKLATFRQDIGQRIVPERSRKKGKRGVKRWIDRFQVVQSEHYLVYTNGPKTSSKRFAKTLEELYEFDRELWPFDDPGHKLTAYIFAQRSEYFDFCVEITGWSREQAERTAGHASGAYYATYFQSTKSEVVMHEATHQIVHACLKVPGVGSWFQEGMAEYAAKKILGERAGSTMRSSLKRGDFYALEDFLTIRSLLGDPRGHGRRNYAQAGSVVEFLMETKDERIRGKFGDFLAASRRTWRRDAETASHLFRKAYGLSLEQVEQCFFEYYGLKKAEPDERIEELDPSRN